MSSCVLLHKDEIIELFKTGVPQKDIADKYYVSRSTINKWLAKWGLVEKKTPKPKEEVVKHKVFADTEYERLMKEAITVKPVDKTPKPITIRGHKYTDVTSQYL